MRPPLGPIPPFLTRDHILAALRRIQTGVFPPKQARRDWCVIERGLHYPPKYVVQVAHEVAKDKPLPTRFKGGDPTNNFLRKRGFTVEKCPCRSRSANPATASSTDPTATHAIAPAGRPAPDRKIPSTRPAVPAPRPPRHSERCAECKTRVQELLVRIYGACERNHGFSWATGLAAYRETAIYPTLQRVAGALQEHRNFRLRDIVRKPTLAPCDYWVPDPGFVVEFDERQHFTHPRRLSLAAYAEDQPLGFDRGRWMDLCARLAAKDNDPPYRDEQRAWYDALRDLVPPLHTYRPTVRLYASDLTWCSLNPDNPGDLERFRAYLGPAAEPSRRTTVPVVAPKPRPKRVLRLALVFPRVDTADDGGVPPSGPGVQKPVIPRKTDFADEDVDCVLFPEGYVRASDSERSQALGALAHDLRAPLLVGATDAGLDATGRVWQTLLRFEPDCTRSRAYVKHSTADAVAFEQHDWEPETALPTFGLGGTTAAATICHDHYLGLFPRFLARRGARIWFNPSYDNVKDVKWSSILRLRAVENRMFSICTLHDRAKKGSRTHPFAYAPDGRELAARPAGGNWTRPLSDCTEPGIYVVELDLGLLDAPFDWSHVPQAKLQPFRPPPTEAGRLAIRGGKPAVLGLSGWRTLNASGPVETSSGRVDAGILPNESILDAAACWRILEAAHDRLCQPILWNHWTRLPADSAQLATLLLGRTLECCAPTVISEGNSIRELVELSSRHKIPVRRRPLVCGEAIADLRWAWGLKNAFRMVTKHLPRGMKKLALDRYRQLA